MCDHPFCPGRHLADTVVAAFCVDRLAELSHVGGDVLEAMRTIADACVPFLRPEDASRLLDAIERAGAVADAERILEEHQQRTTDDEGDA